MTTTPGTPDTPDTPDTPSAAPSGEPPQRHLLSRADLVPSLMPRLGDYWQTVYRRTWRGSVVTSFLLPFLYLTAMGVGLGSFVDANSGPSALDGVSYLAFIAPGLLATTAMEAAIGESTYPVMAGFKWHRFYHSMAASPLREADIVGGQVMFIAVRILLTCSVFLVVLAAYGALDSPLGGLAALLVVVLLGMAYATPMIAITARMKSESGFALVFRLGLMPMVLFSGAFFPISQLPDPVVWLAYLTPIWHGVGLARDLTLGTATVLPTLGHLAYLLASFLVGWYAAVTGFKKRLSQ